MSPKEKHNDKTCLSFLPWAGIPDTTRQSKKRDARFREHDNEKMLVIFYTRHN